jgi:hypothetical protein
LYRRLGMVMTIIDVMIEVITIMIAVTTDVIMTTIAETPADTVIPVAINSLNLFCLARNSG